MDGIIVVDKPQGFTSFDVVAKMRGMAGTRKIGHGGTLDPMATGVLPVFIGRSAKAVDMQPRQDKAYEAEILFGLKTDTGDITGTILEQAETQIDQQKAALALPHFLGEQSQLPPMYSAVKIQGKPLYKYAREGKQVERRPRRVNIFSIDMLPLPEDYTPEQRLNRIKIYVHCSKGTYIRTLAEDIGEYLGVPATLAALRRTRAGAFSQQDAYTMEQLQQAADSGGLQQLLLPVETVFSKLPALEIDAGQMHRLRNGVALENTGLEEGEYRILGPDGFAGVGEINKQGILKNRRLFVLD